MARSRPTPAAGVTRAVTALALTIAPAAVLGSPAHGDEAAPLVAQDGWWNKAVGPQEGEPANPLRTTAGPLIPGPTTVPADALGVGAAAGEPDKIAALGLTIPAAPGDSVTTLTLTLTEAGGAQANPNSSSAAIVACPITSFWAGARNAQWVDRPQYDCAKAQAAGVRAEDGTWTFDLLPLAALWTDPAAGVSQNGFVLVEAVDAPQSFQVSFQDGSTQPYAVQYAATPAGGDGLAGWSGDMGTGDAGGDLGFDSGTSYDPGVSFDAGTPVFDTPRGDVAAGPAPAPTRPSLGRTRPAAVSAPAAVGLGSGLAPVAAVFGPVLLVLAALVSYVLGPAGRPAAVARRTGGVSRALTSRSRA